MMKQKIVLNTIIDEIYQIENYIQRWRDNEEVPSIERDLVQHKLQEIYDQVINLNAASHISSEHKNTERMQIITKAEPLKSELTAPGPVHEIVFENTREITEAPKPIIQEIPFVQEVFKEPAREVVKEPINEIVKEPVSEVMKEPVREIIEVSVSKTEVEIEKNKTGSKEILAEKLTQTHKLIHETVKSRSVMDVSSKLKNAPIPSIQSAINLNDKFLFIRELFKNNNLLYNQTLERLNNAKSYEDALTIVEREFAWDMNEPLVQKLVELVKRKHNA